MRSLRSKLILIFVSGALLSPSAHALIYYFEFGAGLASVSNVQGIYPNETSSSLTSPIAIPLTLGVNLQSSQRGLLFQIAAQSRYITSSTQSIVTSSPMLRIEFWRLVLGAGYSPWVWQNVSFKKLEATSITYEAQFLMPITPEIDFGLQAAMQTITPKSGGTAASTLDYGAFFRLNFGMSSTQSNERRKYKGWRYPFGSPLK